MLKGKELVVSSGCIIVIIIVLLYSIVYSRSEKNEVRAERDLPIQETAEMNQEVQLTESISIFYGDQNAEFILDKEIMVLNKDEVSITNALISEGILREGIKVQHFLLEEKEGEKCIQIDFNYLFEEQLQSYGTSGERIFIGSVCNTFLSAYDADFIKIKIGRAHV